MTHRRGDRAEARTFRKGILGQTPHPLQGPAASSMATTQDRPGTAPAARPVWALRPSRPASASLLCPTLSPAQAETCPQYSPLGRQGPRPALWGSLAPHVTGRTFPTQRPTDPGPWILDTRDRLDAHRAPSSAQVPTNRSQQPGQSPGTIPTLSQPCEPHSTAGPESPHFICPASLRSKPAAFTLSRRRHPEHCPAVSSTPPPTRSPPGVCRPVPATGNLSGSSKPWLLSPGHRVPDSGLSSNHPQQ